MAETIISKIKVRQGNLSDLPILDSGELGYATDARRLFIGNESITVGTGNGVDTNFVVDVDISSPNILTVLVDSAQVNAADYSLVGTTLTFASPPANGSTITVKYNSEIELDKDASNPVSISLSASGNLADTGFQFDTTQFDTCIIDYTLKSSNGLRVGQLRVAVDTNSSTTAIDDQYTQTGAVDVVFGPDISVTDTLKLVYTDNDNQISTFKFTYQLWNSN
jgi:hypothetical protein